MGAEAARPAQRGSGEQPMPLIPLPRTNAPGNCPGFAVGTSPERTPAAGEGLQGELGMALQKKNRPKRDG